MSALRIGVIVDDPAQASALRGVISAAGLQTKVALDLARVTDKIATEDIDAWVLNLDVGKLEAESPEVLGYLLDNIHVPVILCEGDIPGQANPLFPNWRRRLVEKLNSLNATINRSQRGSPPLPRSVWVLAGSVGGPDAVKKFLDALPPDLGIAFIYANHIERDFQGVLTQVMGRKSHYEAYAPQHGDLLRENSIAVISPEHVTSVMADGSFNVRDTPWSGQYKPNLDQVVATAAVHFGHTGGVIIFSGMCDDGAAASRLVRRRGGQVWTQDRDSCVSWAMPDAAEMAVGKVDFCGDPVALAGKLVEWVKDRDQVQASQAR